MRYHSVKVSRVTPIYLSVSYYYYHSVPSVHNRRFTTFRYCLSGQYSSEKEDRKAGDDGIAKFQQHQQKYDKQE